MSLHVGGEFELVAWIMSFGPSAVVLSPDRLRRRIQADLDSMAATYRREVTVAPVPGRKSKKKVRKAPAVAKR